MTATWTRLVRFVSAETGKIHIGQPVDSSIDVGLEILAHRPVKVHAIEASPDLQALDPNAKVNTSSELTIKKLLLPIAPETVGIVRCIGLNYYDHAEETKMAVPTVPTLFYKPYTSLTSPSSTIVIPRVAQPIQTHLPDYEAELAIVIGPLPAFNVPESSALDYVLGYTAANDVSFRYHQMTGTTQWGFSKSFDKTTPLGPVLVNAKVLGDAQNLPVRSFLNGEPMQDGNTKNQIFGVAKLVSYLSQGTTLLPGSVIITGTPHGVGFVRKPPVLLKHGDDIRVFLGGGIGTLANPIVEEGKDTSGEAKL